jgi:hypothetical protein
MQADGHNNTLPDTLISVEISSGCNGQVQQAPAVPTLEVTHLSRTTTDCPDQRHANLAPAPFWPVSAYMQVIPMGEQARPVGINFEGGEEQREEV